MSYSHQPVLLTESLELLNLASGQTVVDGTVGLGGHSEEIIQRIQPNGRLIGIDLDSSALEITRKRLANSSVSIDLFCDNFRNLGAILRNAHLAAVDAILLDLGLSSYQLAEPPRGFSFQSPAPLDMRMNRENSTTAADIINRAPESELVRIFQEYGEERFSKRIARRIVNIRGRQKIATTTDLANLIQETTPGKWGRINPATRVFQALRITVNEELTNLTVFLKDAEQYLKPGGRLAIISFHSLEDRLVKQAFVEKKRNGLIRVLTKKPVRPSEAEVESNPRARSARLRGAEKI